ncbi:MAG: hypothetical protein U0790_00500 [Isosphaeraceae bacterium]
MLHRGALVGGYYWFPSPLDGRTAWAVLGYATWASMPGVGHVDLWPAVVDRLAAAWGRDARTLRRRLGDRYGPPRVGSPGRGGRCWSCTGTTPRCLTGGRSWSRLAGSVAVPIDSYSTSTSGGCRAIPRVEEVLGFRYD